MSVLMDLLAYNTHYLAFHANMGANEMFLDSSLTRASAVSHGKGSWIHSIIYDIKCNYITVSNVPTSQSSLVMAGTIFTTVNDTTYNFVTISDTYFNF